MRISEKKFLETLVENISYKYCFIDAFGETQEICGKSSTFMTLSYKVILKCKIQYTYILGKS